MKKFSGFDPRMMAATAETQADTRRTEIMTKPSRIETEPHSPVHRGEIGKPPKQSDEQENLVWNPFEARMVPKPYIPKILRSVTTGLEYEVAKERFLLWKCRILRDCKVCGQNVHKDDTVTMTGDLAAELAMNFQAEIIDDRLQEEQDVLRKAKKLGYETKTVRDLARFARDDNSNKERKKWRDKMSIE